MSNCFLDGLPVKIMLSFELLCAWMHSLCLSSRVSCSIIRPRDTYLQKCYQYPQRLLFLSESLSTKTIHASKSPQTRLSEHPQKRVLFRPKRTRIVGRYLVCLAHWRPCLGRVASKPTAAPCGPPIFPDQHLEKPQHRHGHH